MQIIVATVCTELENNLQTKNTEETKLNEKELLRVSFKIAVYQWLFS